MLCAESSWQVPISVKAALRPLKQEVEAWDDIFTPLLASGLSSHDCDTTRDEETVMKKIMMPVRCSISLSSTCFKNAEI